MADAFAISAKDLLPKEIYPEVDAKLLFQCNGKMSTECLADIAWALARKGEGSQLAPRFAALGSQTRAESLLGAIPEKDAFSKRFAQMQVDAYLLALKLSHGDIAPLSAVEDQQVIAWAAHRILGYLDRPPRGKRIELGFGEGNARLSANLDVTRALLLRWEQLLRKGVPYGSLPSSYGRRDLASMWLLLGDTKRARAAMDGPFPKSNYCNRERMTIWIHLEDLNNAVASLGTDAASNGMCRTDIAKWLIGQGRAAEGAAFAREGGEELLAAKKYSWMLDAIEILAQTNQKPAARDLATRAEQVGWNDIMSVFNVSTAGMMFGLIGDFNECQRLQAKAMGAKIEPGTPVDWTRLPRKAEWGDIYDLGRALTNEVAARRIYCGDPTALAEIDNRTLARNYCELYKAGRLKFENIKTRKPAHDDDVPGTSLVDSAAECHFELREDRVAESLLDELTRAAKNSEDYWIAHGAAELSCVYASRDRCSAAIRLAGHALIKAVQERRLSAYSVLVFADNWRKWIGP